MIPPYLKDKVLAQKPRTGYVSVIQDPSMQMEHLIYEYYNIQQKPVQGTKF
jgi:hypothetical protein